MPFNIRVYYVSMYVHVYSINYMHTYIHVHVHVLLIQVLIIDVKTLSILKYFRAGSSSVAIKSIEFARRGSNFIINGSDRVMRVYDIEEVLNSDTIEDDRVEAEPLQRLQDNVNRTQWKKCVFSGRIYSTVYFTLNLSPGNKFGEHFLST